MSASTPLPPTKDKFWPENAHRFQVNPDEVRAALNNHHKYIVKGGFLVCQSCPFEHTLAPKKRK